MSSEGRVGSATRGLRECAGAGGGSREVNWVAQNAGGGVREAESSGGELGAQAALTGARQGEGDAAHFSNAAVAGREGPRERGRAGKRARRGAG